MNTIGSMVRIKPELFGTSPKFDEMYGDLGYVGLMQHFIFQIIKLEKDPNRGEIAYAKIMNPDVLLGIVSGLKSVKNEGELVLQLKDLVPANMKTTLVYTIEELTNPKAGEIADLFKARKRMQNAGKSKTSSDMKANWQAITSARSAGGGDKVRVHIPSKRMYFDIIKKDLPDEEEKSISEFKMKLAGMLRSVRSERKNFVRNASDVKITDVFGIGVKKEGGVFTEKNSLAAAYAESLKTSLETPKKPVDPKANYVGIEIEFIYRNDYDTLKKLLIAERLHRYVDLTTDGSLRVCHSNGGYETKEMRVICKNTEVRMVMDKIQRVFNNPRIDAYVNRSCGLHVHLDMRNRDVKQCYTNLVRVQNILRGSQPIGRVSNTHCKANDIDTLKFIDGEALPHRYSVVNPAAFKKHQTLEVRIHEGTVDCSNITDWVDLLDSIVSHSSIIPKNTAKKASELVSDFGLVIPMNAVKYVDIRIDKFDSLSVG